MIDYTYHVHTWMSRVTCIKKRASHVTRDSGLYSHINISIYNWLYIIFIPKWVVWRVSKKGVTRESGLYSHINISIYDSLCISYSYINESCDVYQKKESRGNTESLLSKTESLPFNIESPSCHAGIRIIFTYTNPVLQNHCHLKQTHLHRITSIE